MPKDFLNINKKCLYCGKKLILHNARDIKRKKYCSKSCLGKSFTHLKNIWKNPILVKKIKKNMSKKHHMTIEGLKAIREYRAKKRHSWRWFVENGTTIKFHQSQDWRDKTKEIFKRDNYTCQHCDRDANLLRKVELKLNCHHIIPLCNGGALFDDNNLITLCSECHALCHPEIKFFKKELNCQKNLLTV